MWTNLRSSKCEYEIFPLDRDKYLFRYILVFFFSFKNMYKIKQIGKVLNELIQMSIDSSLLAELLRLEQSWYDILCLSFIIYTRTEKASQSV